MHVARLAWLPRSVVRRAQEILDELESGRPVGPGVAKRWGKPEPAQQIALFPEKSPVLEELAKVDVESLTPLEALTKLFELQKKVKEQ